LIEYHQKHEGIFLAIERLKRTSQNGKKNEEFIVKSISVELDGLRIDQLVS
jgi:hypothetical protein